MTQSFGVVAGGHEQRAGGVGADAVAASRPGWAAVRIVLRWASRLVDLGVEVLDAAGQGAHGVLGGRAGRGEFAGAEAGGGRDELVVAQL